RPTVLKDLEVARHQSVDVGTAFIRHGHRHRDELGANADHRLQRQQDCKEAYHGGCLGRAPRTGVRGARSDDYRAGCVRSRRRYWSMTNPKPSAPRPITVTATSGLAVCGSSRAATVPADAVARGAGVI